MKFLLFALCTFAVGSPIIEFHESIAPRIKDVDDWRKSIVGGAKLKHVHPVLAEVTVAVSKYIPLVVITTTRSYAEQKKKVAAGLSKTMKSLHLLNSAAALPVVFSISVVFPNGLGWPFIGPSGREWAALANEYGSQSTFNWKWPKSLNLFFGLYNPPSQSAPHVRQSGS